MRATSSGEKDHGRPRMINHQLRAKPESQRSSWPACKGSPIPGKWRADRVDDWAGDQVRGGEEIWRRLNVTIFTAGSGP